MYNSLYLSPVIPSFNLKETSLFFKSRLDFKAAREEKNYVILYKDNLTIHILNAGPDIGQVEFYLEVDDADYV